MCPEINAAARRACAKINLNVTRRRRRRRLQSRIAAARVISTSLGDVWRVKKKKIIKRLFPSRLADQKQN